MMTSASFMILIMHCSYCPKIRDYSVAERIYFRESMVDEVTGYKCSHFVKIMYHNCGFVDSVILNCLLGLVASCISSCNCPICSSRKSLSFSSGREVPKHAFPVELCLLSSACCHSTAAYVSHSFKNRWASPGPTVLCLLNSSFTYWSPRALRSGGRARCSSKIRLYKARTLETCFPGIAPRLRRRWA